MHAERIWILLAKRQAGEATEQELKELTGLMADGKGSAGSELIEKVWNAPLQSLPELKPGQNVWARIDNNINEPVTKLPFLRRPPVRWLAAALLTGTVAALFFLYQQPRQVGGQTAKSISTHPSSKKYIVLPDGTQVWLHGNSKLHFPGNFTGRSREVNLEGEAFFDVVKKEGQPFIIHAANVNITVKGTAFNVKAYPGQEHVETSLIRGLVEITTSHDPERKILLKPQEKIMIPVEVNGEVSHPDKEKTNNVTLFTITRLQKDEHNVLPETVWMNKSLAFDNEPLEQLVPKLESWFAVTIHIEDASLKSRRFSGEITKETIGQTLEAFKLSYPFSYRINKDEIWINKK